MKKPTLNNEQIKQMKNISETLIEATEHLIKDIENRDYVQTIQLFTSIVEGFNAIKSGLLTYKHSFKEITNLISYIEENFLVIIEALEKKEFTTLQQIVRFSLLQNFTKLHKMLNSEVSAESSKITIGIYYDKARPKEVYPKERINSLIKEAEKQKAELLFFCSEDIDFQEKKINGEMYIDNKWKEIKSGLPDVVHNIFPVSKHQLSVPERKLRRLVPFTSFGVGNKFYLPKIMLEHRVYANLLVPFRVITEVEVVHEYLEKEKRAVLKPILGAQGKYIFFIQKRGNRFSITDHTRERIFNRRDFDEWIKQVALRRKFSYMIQRYIEARTKEGEPFDIRAHMQKNGEGKWIITRIYPRIGAKQSILSNISRGGRTDELKNFLIEEYGYEKGKTYHRKLKELALDFTNYLDRVYNFSLDEIGLDLAIDKEGNFWLHEANNSPQSTYHEEERAVNTIGYCLYVAKKGIVKQGQIDSSKGKFDARKSNLPFAETDDCYRVGMLKSSNDDNKLAEACAYVAHYENVQFYTFTPDDIDFNEMLIKGQFFENGEWISKIVEYPDVIYDRFRLKGVGRYNDIYEELDGIPFTNEFYGNSISKLEVYDKLRETGKLDDVLIPYKQVQKNKDIFDFIDKFDAVILKPAVGSFARGVHYISKENNHYFVAEKDKEETHTEISLRNYLNELMKEGIWIVQQYINSRTIDGNPFDIRVHMMKDGCGEWAFVNTYPRIGIHYATISATTLGGYISEINGFLKRNFPKLNVDNIKKEINSISKQITNIFASFYDNIAFNEIAFDFAIDRSGSLYFIELNVNKPGIISEFDIARKAIPNAIYLAESRKNKK